MVESAQNQPIAVPPAPAIQPQKTVEEGEHAVEVPPPPNIEPVLPPPEETKLQPPQVEIVPSENDLLVPPAAATPVAKATANTELELFPVEKVPPEAIPEIKPEQKEAPAPAPAAEDDAFQPTVLPSHNIAADLDDGNGGEVEELGKEDESNVSKVHCIEVNFSHAPGDVNNRTLIAAKQTSFLLAGEKPVYTEPDDLPLARMEDEPNKEQVVPKPQPVIPPAPKVVSVPAVVDPLPLPELPLMTVPASETARRTPEARLPDETPESKVDPTPAATVVSSPVRVADATTTDNVRITNPRPKDSPATLTVQIGTLDKSVPVTVVENATRSSQIPSSGSNNVSASVAKSNPKEEVKLADIQLQENLSDMMQFEGEDEGALSRSVRDVR